MATHTLVVGPGAIGTLFSSLLIRAGNPVTLLDRDSNRAKHISRNGLRVDGQDATLPVVATATTDDIQPVDLVLLCVKAYDTADATNHAAAACLPGTPVVSLQNGLGNLELIQDRLPEADVIASATFHGASLLGQGHIQHAGSGETILAGMKTGSAFENVITLFKDAGIDASACEKWENLVWSKLAMNAAINPITALHDITNGEILSNTTLRSLMHAAVDEVTEIAATRELALLYDDPHAEAEHVCRETSSNYSSMLLDVRKHRRTEIESINGRVVEEAKRMQIPVPVNRKLLDAVRELDKRGPV